MSGSAVFPGLPRSRINAIIEGYLADYYTQTQVDTALAGYYTKTQVDTLLVDYYTASEVDTELNLKANVVHTHDDRYYTETETDTLLTGYSLTSHTHSTYAALSHVHSAADITSSLLALERGGTNANLSATGGSNQFLKQTSSGGAVSVEAILASDLTSALTTPPAIGGTTPATGAFSTLAIGTSTQPTRGEIIEVNEASTNSSLSLLTLRRLTTGTAANNLGAALVFEGEDIAGSTVLLGRITTKIIGQSATTPTQQMIFSVRNRSDSYGTVEHELLKIGATPNAYNGGIQIMNPLLNTAYFEFAGIAADGRQGLYHFSDATRKQVLASRAGNLVIGSGTQVTIAGMSGNVGVTGNANTVLGAAFFGNNENNAGTHKSMWISTPESVPFAVGTYTRTDMIDLVTFSSVSNTWGGTRPNFRFSALEHIFRVDSTAGAANTGTETFRVQSTGVTVPSTLAFQLGDPTVDGSWRIIRSGNNLVMERRESGAWVTKSTITP